jgi:hypothetical protein
MRRIRAELLLFRKALKLNSKWHPLVIPMIVVIMYTSLFSCAYLVSADDPGIGGIQYPGGNQSGNAVNMFYQFEGRVYVLGETIGNMYVYAIPSGGIITSKFVIEMFANQHCYYQIRLDNQTVDQGDFDFWKRVPLQSQYSFTDIEVTLRNVTGVTLPKFTFSHVTIIPPEGSGTGAGNDNGNGGVSPILEPYIKMTQGEWSLFIIARLFIDIALGVLGYLAGSSLAVIKCDYRGVEQML